MSSGLFGFALFAMPAHAGSDPSVRYRTTLAVTATVLGRCEFTTGDAPSVACNKGVSFTLQRVAPLDPHAVLPGPDPDAGDPSRDGVLQLYF